METAPRFAQIEAAGGPAGRDGQSTGLPAESPVTIAPQSCPNCLAAAGRPTLPPLPVREAAPATSWIYALGQIDPRFPKISVEKEFAQAAGRAETKGLTDRQALRKVLSDPHNRYLLRQLCWVMTISGMETYILVPRQPSDLDLLVESLRPSSELGAIDAVLGMKGPLAPPDLCNGLTLPVAAFEQIYSFDRASLIETIPRPDHADAREFQATAAELLDRILASTDNTGNTDEHRALNYLAVRYPGIYALASDCHRRDLALTAIEGRPWRLSIARKVVEVIFTFTHRKNEFVERFSTRVDVNDLFPFLVSKAAPFYEH